MHRNIGDKIQAVALRVLPIAPRLASELRAPSTPLGAPRPRDSNDLLLVSFRRKKNQPPLSAPLTRQLVTDIGQWEPHPPTSDMASPPAPDRPRRHQTARDANRTGRLDDRHRSPGAAAQSAQSGFAVGNEDAWPRGAAPTRPRRAQAQAPRRPQSLGQWLHTRARTSSCCCGARPPGRRGCRCRRRRCG